MRPLWIVGRLELNRKWIRAVERLADLDHVGGLVGHVPDPFLTVVPGNGQDEKPCARSFDGIESLLDYTIAAVSRQGPDACVIFERSPVDYLAYAAACRDAWSAPFTREFLAAAVPAVRSSLRHLDLIALLPVSDAGPIRPRRDEDERFRKRVDDKLRRALIDDDYDLLDDCDLLRVVELPPLPARQITELMRLTEPDQSR